MANYGLKDLEEATGLTREEMAEESLGDGACPGICTECGAVYDYEPDQDKGWCDDCQKNTVKSCLILMGCM